jgi:diguanylate cyclase (GGDEF)-like protein
MLVGPSMAARLAAGLAWSGPLPAGSALRRRGLRTGGLVAVGPDASLGVLAAFWERPDAGTEDDLAALTALAGHAASALTATVLRQEVRELGVVDPVTRFFNQRYFHARLEQECQRALRAGTPVSIAIMALDGMARARAAGRRHRAEAAIEALAAHVTERLRGMDVGCRVGEDELAAILPEVEGLDALRVGERLRTSVAAAPGLGEGVTLSVGVACFPAQAGRSDTLVAHARSALAWAQEHGGDRTFLYSAETAEILRAEHDEDVVDDESVMATLVALAAGVDARHPATAHHHENVARVAALIAAELGLPTDVVEDVRVAGLVHDVGKIGMADDVIAADDDGDGEAAEELRRHPEIGERMLTGSRIANVAPWIRHHHERVDGTGYPDGLAGEHIPVESRILAVADAWDNLRSGRWGGVRRAPADVMRELESRSGAHLDPVAVAALRALVGRGAAEAPRVP